MGRYEDYNEMMYESYCKVAIDNAILKARMRKAAHGRIMRPLSGLLDTELVLLAKDMEIELPEECLTFYLQGQEIKIKDLRLGQALFSLFPKDREIILLHYFLELRDEAIAKRLNISRATVQRRREAAHKKLRTLLERCQ